MRALGTLAAAATAATFGFGLSAAPAGAVIPAPAGGLLGDVSETLDVQGLDGVVDNVDGVSGVTDDPLVEDVAGLTESAPVPELDGARQTTELTDGVVEAVDGVETVPTVEETVEQTTGEADAEGGDFSETPIVGDTLDSDVGDLSQLLDIFGAGGLPL